MSFNYHFVYRFVFYVELMYFVENTPIQRGRCDMLHARRETGSDCQMTYVQQCLV